MKPIAHGALYTLAICACLHTRALHAKAAPPRVVSATPSHGQAGVDPETVRSLVVEFDQPMRTGSHSWVGGGPTFPKLSGPPVWDSHTTTSLHFKLEPEHDYALSLNSATLLHFRSVNGQPLEAYPIVFSTRELPTTPEANQRTFDALREAVRDRYSYRDRLGVNWDAHFEELKATFIEADSSLRLAVRVAEALAPAQDVHIGVTLDGWTFGTHQANATANFDSRVLGYVVPDLENHGGGVYSATLDERTGYLLITTWGAGASPGSHASDALDGLLKSDRIIIDVRPNGGGDELQARALASRFAEAPVVYAKNLNLSPDGGNEYLGPFERVLAPSPDRDRFTGEVCVLMGRACMSSNEAFLLMMRACGATLVGDRSYGSSGNPRTQDLGSGITITLPSWQAMTAQGEVFEGVGIEPDVMVTHAPRKGGRRDPVLEAALRALEKPSP